MLHPFCNILLNGVLTAVLPLSAGCAQRGGGEIPIRMQDVVFKGTFVATSGPRTLCQGLLSWLFTKASKSVQVLFNGIEAVMELPLITVK